MEDVLYSLQALAWAVAAIGWIVPGCLAWWVYFRGLLLNVRKIRGFGEPYAPYAAAAFAVLIMLPLSILCGIAMLGIVAALGEPEWV